MISPRENYLRSLEYAGPEWIPLTCEILPALAKKYGDALKRMLLKHPDIFPEHTYREILSLGKDPLYTQEAYFTDDWGCRWYNACDGILGQVVNHPLEDWNALSKLKIPDPGDQMDWNTVRSAVKEKRKKGELVKAEPGSFSHGGFFDRLQFLRGLENLLVDFVTDPPELGFLIEMVLEYNLKYIQLWKDTGADIIWFHGDIGSQRGLMISPDMFRKYLKPAYMEMFRTCRDAGMHVWYSSDGNILEIVDDLIECGVSVHDPQVAANGIDGIESRYKGRLCAAVDIDEQMLPFCSTEEIEAQVLEVKEAIGTPKGGLMYFFSPTADVPVSNIEAFFTAWKKHRYLS